MYSKVIQLFIYILITEIIYKYIYIIYTYIYIIYKYIYVLFHYRLLSIQDIE